MEESDGGPAKGPRLSREKFEDLRRRRVVKTAIVYAATGWASLQVTALVFPLLGLNSSAIRWVLWMLSAGFFIAIATAWVSDVRVQRGEAPIRLFSNHALIIVGLLITVGIVAGLDIDPWLEEGQRGHLATITVEPFETRGNLSSEWSLGDDLADDLTDALARFPALTVRRAQSADYTEAGSWLGELGQRYVLSGSVQVDPEHVRVRARLLDTRSGVVRWSEIYDEEIGSAPLLELQSDVAGRIAATLADRTGFIAAEAPRRGGLGRSNHRSMNECLAMADRYFEVHTDEQHFKARECLEHAVKREPENAQAWAHLGYLYREEHHHRRNQRLAPIERAMRASYRAVSLDPSSAMAHFALSATYHSRGKLEASALAAERAIELNENDATLLGLLSNQIAMAGEWDRALEVAERSAKLSPHHPVYLHNVRALDHYLRGDYETALEVHRRINPLDTQRGVARAAALGQTGQAEQAVAIIEDIQRADPYAKADLIGEIKRVYMADDVVESLAEGLRMAGIDLEPREAGWETEHSYPTRSRGHRTKRSRPCPDGAKRVGGSCPS